MSTSTAPSEASAAPSFPQMPPPVAQHAWLQALTGEWTTEVELQCDPDAPPMKVTGRESARMLGGFWLIAESVSDSLEMPFSSIFTVGYNPEKAKYIGTWVDTMTSKLWSYEGTLEEGRKLVLMTDGSCPATPDPDRAIRETTELKSPDHKVFTSEMQQEDGSWRTIVTVESRRVK